ncbi:carbohydrate ABC transporter permease [Agromyces aurantiacus]|uniref:Carbohydrate ABC transporter permease n=1 Tax=Agromyces aurantiacus TaxID=165814 RepID=A0ABV9R0E8_9MICO|nr:carbohydrate ABC transporter permease [Agromyces aurantiacus]MBM7505893.1 putative aldouronate transport system permease protein [Agromyces aurantiacus]
MTTQLDRPITARRGRDLRRRLADPLFSAATMAILGLALVAVIYPLYFIVIASISEPARVYEGQVWFWPVDVTFDGYARLLADPTVWRGLANSVVYTGLATAVSVALVVSAGYVLSRRDLPGRRTLTFLLVVTLFFDGGIIPRFLVVRDLGLLDTVGAMILPGAVAVWNVIVARTFFESNLPDELREAAQMDGASDFRFFFRVALPLSKPLIALMIVIHLVWNWNGFFDALIYLNNPDLYPLQLVLRNILVQSDLSGSANMSGDLQSYEAAQRLAELLKYAAIVFATIPLMLMVPFLQRFFTQGALIGAVKS